MYVDFNHIFIFCRRKFQQNKQKFEKTQKSLKIYSNSLSSASCGVELNISKDSKANEYLIAGIPNLPQKVSFLNIEDRYY